MTIHNVHVCVALSVYTVVEPYVSPCTTCQYKYNCMVCKYCVKEESCVNARSRHPTAFPSQVLINIRLPLVYL